MYDDIFLILFSIFILVILILIAVGSTKYTPTIDMYKIVTDKVVNNDHTLIDEIPKTFYQTHCDIVVTPTMFEAVNSWNSLNIEYSYYLFNDHRSRNFIEINFDALTLETYDSLIPNAYKADLFRYCLLYIKGGFYVDNKMVCLKSVDSYLTDGVDFVTAIDYCSGDNYLYNAIIASKPKHPFIKEAIDLVVENVKNKYYGSNSLEPTGPGLLGHAVNNCLGRSKNKSFKEGIYEFNGSKYRLLNHSDPKFITYSGERVIQTKYNEYDKERKLFYGQKHYSKLYKQRKVYK